MFFYLGDGVKIIIAKHHASDYFISTISKHRQIQKVLFGKIVLDNDFRKLKKTQNDVNSNDDFHNGKIYKIFEDINDVIYSGFPFFSFEQMFV